MSDQLNIPGGINTAGTIDCGGNILTDGYIQILAVSEPSSPGAGNHNLFVDSSDSLLKSKNSSGTVSTYSTGSTLALRSETTDVTVTTANEIILVDATSGEIDVNLPAASTATGQRLKVKKTDSSSNAVIIDPNSTETVDGETTLELTTQYSFVEIVCDGTEWHVTDIFHDEYISTEITSRTETTLANTYTDVGAFTIVLTPGTWDIGYDLTATIDENSAGTNFLGGSVRIATSGGTEVDQTVSYFAMTMPASAFLYFPTSKSTRITITADTTYKLQVRCTEAVATGACAVEGNAIDGNLTNDDNQSIIWARRIK